MASVTLTWTAASPAPANGYRIKYWPTNSPATISTISPNPIASPYTITGLTDNTQYSGTIEASCVGAAYSTAIAWNTIYIGNYYFATKFNCIGCTQVGTNVLVYSSTALTIGTYYKLGNFVYKIETAEPWDNNPIDISAYTASATTCATLCPSSTILMNIYLNFASRIHHRFCFKYIILFMKNIISKYMSGDREKLKVINKNLYENIKKYEKMYKKYCNFRGTRRSPMTPY